MGVRLLQEDDIFPSDHYQELIAGFQVQSFPSFARNHNLVLPG